MITKHKYPHDLITNHNKIVAMITPYLRIDLPGFDKFIELWDGE